MQQEPVFQFLIRTKAGHSYPPATLLKTQSVFCTASTTISRRAHMMENWEFAAQAEESNPLKTSQ